MSEFEDIPSFGIILRITLLPYIDSGDHWSPLPHNHSYGAICNKNKNIDGHA